MPAITILFEPGTYCIRRTVDLRALARLFGASSVHFSTGPVVRAARAQQQHLGSAARGARKVRQTEAVRQRPAAARAK